MPGSLKKAKISKEDCQLQSDELYPTETYDRVSSTGATVSLTKVPDIWKTHSAVINARNSNSGVSTDATITAAISGINGSRRSLYIEPASWVINNNLTIPSTIHLICDPTDLKIATGKTLTINGPFSAPIAQVFSGAGSVSFGAGSIKEDYPQWWGGVPGSTSDQSTYIQAALTAAGDGIPTILIDGQWYGDDIAPPAYSVLEGTGKGAILRAYSNPTNAVIYINANNVIIRNLKVHGNSDNAVTAKGVSIASGGYSSKSERVFISHCADDGVYVNDANDIKLDDCEFITMTGTQIINLSSATQCLIDKCRLETSDVDYAIITAGVTQGFNTAETVTIKNCWFEFTNANTIVDTIRLGHTPARILNNYFVVGSTNATHANHINIVAGTGTSGHVRIAMNDFHRKGATAKDITNSANSRDVDIILNRIDDPLNDIVDNGQGTFFMGLMDYTVDAHGLIAKKLQLYERSQSFPAVTFDLNSIEMLLHNANSQNLGIKQKTTLLSPMAGATHTWASAIPAGSQAIGVSARVTTLITGATTMDIGDGTDVDIFVDGMVVAKDTTADLADCNDGTLLPNTYKTATNIVVKAIGGAANFSAGALRLTLYYIDLTPPTS